MSYALKVIKDNPIMLLPLDETSGSIAYDISGCGNNGSHSDGIISGLLPLIPGGATGTKITNTKYVNCSLDKNYYGQQQVVSFGQDGFSDNDFSMEIWIYPNFNTSENLIFGDQVNDIGISWEKGNLIFKLNSEILEYTVPYFKKALHIVAVYSVNAMLLYLDGTLVAAKQLFNFKFSNSYLNVSVGPTAASNSSFIVDAPAIYRYALSDQQIKQHYDAGVAFIPPIQIAYPDGGVVHSLSDENTPEIFNITYPVVRSLERLLVDGLSYDKITKSIYMTIGESGTALSVETIDTLPVISNDSIVRSKISWEGDNGIAIFASINGTDYTECANGFPIPDLETSIPSGCGELFVKIVFTSSDISKYNPELFFLDISFYSSNKIIALNSPEYVEPTTGSIYTVGSKNHPPLSRDLRNGLRILSGNSFKINNSRATRTVEMFYMREASGAGGILINGSTTKFEWNSSGNISKNNISSIYVNGIDMSSQTAIASVFAIGELYHVIICLSVDIDASSDIIFNESLSGNSIESLYDNVTLYDYEFDGSLVSEHYNIYAGRPLVSITDNTISLTEQAISVHTNDWAVIKSI